jgi:hypothetical protein
MLPWTGGLSGFGLTAGLFPAGPLGVSDGLELAKRSPRVESAMAAIKPNVAAALSNSLLCILFVGSFMTSTI